MSEFNADKHITSTSSNTFYAIFPPLFTISSLLFFEARMTMYLSTACLTILCLLKLNLRRVAAELLGFFGLSRRGGYWVEADKASRNLSIKFIVGGIVMVTKFFLTTLLILYNTCVKCVDIYALDLNLNMLPVDLVVMAILKPVAVDLYYNFFLFERLNIGRYNKYFTFITRLFYETVDYMTVFEVQTSLNLFIVEALWLFYLSYIGKYNFLNSTFLRVCGDISDFIVIFLVNLGFLGVKNNFYFALF
jgi:hypothetical protein